MSNLKKTTTTIPLEEFNYIRTKGYKVSELVLLGLKAREDNPQLIERIRNVENTIPDINEKLVHIRQMLFDCINSKNN
jgi:hypothetical protein